MSKLKPCPFCGGEAILHDGKDNPAGEYWVGCGCDLTEPDGMTYPELKIVGNVKELGLKELVEKVWEHRSSILEKLDFRMQEYLDNLDTDSNILSACGGSRTHFLFKAYRQFVKKIVASNL